MNIGFPDVCLTPVGPAPVPIPYPNFGMNVMSMPFCPNILVTAMPAHNMSAMPMMTMGDNAGVAHPLVMQTGACIMGMPNVLMNGLPTETLLNPEEGNMFNCPLDFKLVPSLVNVVVNAALRPRNNHAADPYAGVITPAEWTAVFANRLGRAAIRRRGGEKTATLVIRAITPALATELRAEWRRVSALGVTRLTLDLRDCRGGSVRGALDAAALFAAPGAVLGRMEVGGHSVAFTSAQSPSEIVAPTGLTIRVNSRTASAAEWLAAALRDSANARIVGGRTYGKGLAQLAFAAPAQAAAPIVLRSVARLFDASGQPLEARGVTPAVV